MESIGISKQQPPGLGTLSASHQGIAFSTNALSGLAGADHAHSGKRFGNGAGAVGGAVVHHGDLEVNSLLAEQRLQATSDALLFIARRDDHLNVWILRLRIHAKPFIIRGVKPLFLSILLPALLLTA